MKTYRTAKWTMSALMAIGILLILVSSCDKNDDSELEPLQNIPSWMHGEYLSQDSVLHFIIGGDSINTLCGLKYFKSSVKVTTSTDELYQFITSNGCTHTFTKDGENIKYNMKVPGDPGAEAQVGGIASFIIKGVLKIVKITINSVYGKNAPGLATSDSRLYVLIKYSGSNYSVSSTEFLADGSVSEVASDWITAEDAVGPDGSGISYSDHGYLHLVKGGVDEVRSYYTSDIDQGVSGNSHLATGVAIDPCDPDTYGDYTYLIDGGSQKKIYIGKFYPDQNKHKIDKMRIMDNGGCGYIKGLCLSPDGKMIFVTHTIQDCNLSNENKFAISSYSIDATSDDGAMDFTKHNEMTKSHSYECWPMACDCDGSLLYVLIMDYDGGYNYYVAVYQMDLSDTDIGWIKLSDYLQPDSDFEPSDLVARGDYLYISNGKKDGNDGLKVLELQMQDAAVRQQVGAQGLNKLREARLNGLEWTLTK